MSITQAVMYETSEANISRRKREKLKSTLQILDQGGKLHGNVVTCTIIIMLIPTLVPHCHSNIVIYHRHQNFNTIVGSAVAQW